MSLAADITGCIASSNAVNSNPPVASHEKLITKGEIDPFL